MIEILPCDEERQAKGYEAYRRKLAADLMAAKIRVEKERELTQKERDYINLNMMIVKIGYGSAEYEAGYVDTLIRAVESLLETDDEEDRKKPGGIPGPDSIGSCRKGMQKKKEEEETET